MINSFVTVRYYINDTNYDQITINTNNIVRIMPIPQENDDKMYTIFMSDGFNFTTDMKHGIAILNDKLNESA